jgi:hypothetical protein
MSNIKRKAPTTTHKEAEIASKKPKKTIEFIFEVEKKISVTTATKKASIKNNHLSIQIWANEFTVLTTGKYRWHCGARYVKAKVSFTLPAKLDVGVKFKHNPYIVYVDGIGTKVRKDHPFEKTLDENSKSIRICHPVLAEGDYSSSPDEDEEEEEETYNGESCEEEQSEETDGDY